MNYKPAKFFAIMVSALTVSLALCFAILAWTEPSAVPPNGNISAPLNTGSVAQSKTGDLGATRLCINGNCREAWPDSPLSDLTNFTAGHLYPYEGTIYLRDSSYPFPYITLKQAVEKAGIDSNNSLATNWFPLGYSYWYPWVQYRSSVFIQEGDNSFPRNLYIAASRNNPNDTFAFGLYTDANGIGQIIYDESFCMAAAGCEKRYASSASNVKGYVLFQIRMKPWWQSDKCVHDYLPAMSLASWGDPAVTNFRVNNYQLPDIKGDICYGANIHSKIEGRFIVTDSYGLRADPIMNFYNAGQSFTYMIEKLGVAYLRFIQ